MVLVSSEVRSWCVLRRCALDCVWKKSLCKTGVSLDFRFPGVIVSGVIRLWFFSRFGGGNRCVVFCVCTARRVLR
jgi:hypothetical protein